jgi:hypothetical protein
MEEVALGVLLHGAESEDDSEDSEDIEGSEANSNASKDEAVQPQTSQLFCPFPLCVTSFAKDAFRPHIIHHHRIKKYYDCPISGCRQSLQGLTTWNIEHLLSHFTVPIDCDLCDTRDEFIKRSSHPKFGIYLPKYESHAEYKKHLRVDHKARMPISQREALTYDPYMYLKMCGICRTGCQNLYEYYSHLDDCRLRYLLQHNSKVAAPDQAQESTVEEWERYREEIIELFRTLSLYEVITKMEDSYAFTAT